MSSLSLITDEQLEQIIREAQAELNRRVKERREEDAAIKLRVDPSGIEFRGRRVGIGRVDSLKKCRGIYQELLCGPIGVRIKFLKLLLLQDWSHLFRVGDTDRRYYVYMHMEPSRGWLSLPAKLGGPIKAVPFYIGKGTDARAYDLNRNQGHGAKLRVLKSRGYGPDDIVRIIKSGLTERQAFELEAKLIYFFGTVYEPDRKGILVNLDTCARPVFEEMIPKFEMRPKKAKTAEPELLREAA